MSPSSPPFVLISERSMSDARWGAKQGEPHMEPISIASTYGTIRVAHLSHEDQHALHSLPWGVPLDDWTDPQYGVDVINQRRGMSRHPVIFVRAGAGKYAIKETSPAAAEHEIANYREIARRGCPALSPVGDLTVAGAAIPAGEVNGVVQYISGDMGYCITRLATRVLPHSLLYQYPFTDQNKRILLIAVARLLATLHHAGVYWGDASLANVLIDLSKRRLLAVLADAETVELFPQPVSDMLRQQDVAYFVEALAWQSEDIRLARDLPEDATVLDENDAEFFQAEYEELWRSPRRRHLAPDAESALVRLGGGVAGLGAWAARASRAGVEATLRPAWYREQLRDLIGIWIPHAYARRVYDLVLGHRWLMSEAAGHDVGLAAAAEDWRRNYHDPVMHLLHTYAPDQPPDYDRYLAIMHHNWQVSQREHRIMPIEEGAIDYLLPKVE